MTLSQKGHSNILSENCIYDSNFQIYYINLIFKSQNFSQVTIQRVTSFYTPKYLLFPLHYISPVILINHLVVYVSSQKKGNKLL